MSRRGLACLLVVAAVAAFLIMLQAPVRRILGPAFSALAAGQFAQFQHHLQALGPWGPVLSIALLVAAAFAVPVPVTIVMVADGLVFGTRAGTLISFVGGLLGALSAYLVGRHFSLAVMERFLSAMGARVSAGSTVPFVRWALVLWHWMPGMPCNPMSYAAGCARMPISSFLFFTTVGLLPACALTAYLGVRAADDLPAQYWLPGLLIVCAVWLGWRLTRRHRDAPPLGMLPTR